jgi:hypothetical protein
MSDLVEMTKNRRGKKCRECGSSACSLRCNQDGEEHLICAPCVKRINRMIENAEREAGEFIRTGGTMS